LKTKFWRAGSTTISYCINPHDGTLVWDYETGFEIDGSTIVVDGRIYFGCEDHNFYCLNLADGKLIYKVPVGSVEGSITMKDGRVYLCTEGRRSLLH
jgi:outer membrane protein assembly factor BamB